MTTTPEPPPCLYCKGRCPDDPRLAFVVGWMGMPVGYVCSEACAKAYHANGGVTNSDGSITGTPDPDAIPANATMKGER